MSIKSISLFLIMLAFLGDKKIEAEPISAMMIGCAVGGTVFAWLGSAVVLESTKKVVKKLPNTEETRIQKRKNDCAGYRKGIEDLEEILRQNADREKFYSGILAPAGYVRYLLGYDEALKERNVHLLKEIRILRDLLEQNYCTEVEEDCCG